MEQTPREITWSSGSTIDSTPWREITRYGHGMAVPVPGTLAHLARPAMLRSDRLLFAHADWSGYSVFEEAFMAGHRAGGSV